MIYVPWLEKGGSTTYSLSLPLSKYVAIVLELCGVEVGGDELTEYSTKNQPSYDHI